jgi:hypothetical protein
LPSDSRSPDDYARDGHFGRAQTANFGLSAKLSLGSAWRSQDAILVRPGEPPIADHIRAKDRRDFPGLAYGAPSVAVQTSAKTRQKPSWLT